jgi:hypothetical protein
MSDGRKILYLIDIGIKTFPLPFFLSTYLYTIFTIFEYFNTKYLKLSQIWFENYSILIEMVLMFWVSYFIWTIISDKIENS